jgi:hypothetical protein
MAAVSVSPAVAVTPIDRLLQVDTIYVEPAAAALPRGQEVLARFPDAERIEVPSHWQIPGLHGNEGNVGDWNRIKRTHLVVGTLKSPRLRPNGRSSDFIAPSQANGCAMSCAYCYVPRRKGFANPITVFANAEQILRATERHIARQGRKAEPNQCDPVDWVYDIGENSDCSVDAWVSGNVRDYVELFARTDGAKASFATKAVNRSCSSTTRAAAPACASRSCRATCPAWSTCARTPSSTASRDRRVRRGGLRGPRQPLPRHRRPGLARGVGRAARRARRRHGPGRQGPDGRRGHLPHAQRPPARGQPRLAPAGEEVLWTPETQEPKRSQTGGWNVRYRSGWKGARVRELLALIERRTPWLRVRYAF